MSMTATMLSMATFDAQMMDYPADNDVPMHSSSSESWYLAGDLAMEDDTPNLPKVIPGVERTIPTIEVDMEDWAPESVEYEMADEAEILYDSVAPLDVEVYDVSQITSQTHSPSALDIPQPLPEHIIDHPHLLSPSFSPAIEVPMVPESDSALNIPDEERDVESTRVVGDPSSSPHVPQHTLTDSQAPHASSEVDDASGSTYIVVADARTVDNDRLLSEASSNSTEVSHHQDLAQETETAVSHTEESVVDQPSVVTTSEQYQEEYARGLIQEGVDGNYEQAGETHDNSTDPHEISEGVYIDPPPAVLMSFSLDDTEFELYLFNHPTPASGASTPTANHPSASFKMLLHEQPTLYYEPLSTVFEALRQEPDITRLSDFTNGELVLNAYDLDLSISEDNVYAREISLHDLNVLHDGSKFSGPLRTHLHSSTPRFIYRYHEIQYQIAHLTIAGDAGDAPPNAEGRAQDGQEEGHVDRPVIEGENAGQQSEEYPEQWQDQPSHEGEETEAPEETVTGDILHHSEDLLENQEQPEENIDHAEVQDDDAGADSHEHRREHDEPNVPSRRPDLETQEDSHQGDDEQLSGGGPANADADEGSQAPEKHNPSADSLTIPEVEQEGDKSVADDDNDNDAHDHDEQQTESLDQSHHITEHLGHDDFDNSTDTQGTHFDDVGYTHEQEDDFDDGPSLAHSEVPVANESLNTGQASFDHPTDEPEYPEGGWDAEFDGEAFDDGWEYENDAESNQSSVTLSSSSTKRTYDEVEADDEPEHGSAAATATPSRLKRLRSQHPPESQA